MQEERYVEKRENSVKSRRHFLQGGLLAAAGALLPRTGCAEEAPQWVMLIDLNRCLGCQACVMACKAVHDVPGQFRTRISVGEDSARRAATFRPVLCSQCGNAACIPACPAGAMSRGTDGVVHLDKERCTGCGRCVEACPQQAVYLDENGKADKCCFCRETGNGQPPCVSACASHARLFGDLAHPDAQLTAWLAAGPNGISGGTPEDCRVCYLPLRNDRRRP